MSVGKTTWNVYGEEFEVDNKYEVIEFLGSGAYGVVCAVHDTNEGSIYALKKCKQVFHSRTLAKRTLREIRLLRHFQHDNIISIKSVFMPGELRTFSNIYILMELMETDLGQIIKSPQTLQDQHVQYFLFQILSALTYLHNGKVVHRDLKPRNLLVNTDCVLKIADFGLARVYDDSNDSKIVAMTEYVTTRWYRAPEIIVGWSRYSIAVDMWAVGCILAELLGRQPLFPGSDSTKQLEIICQVRGKPNSKFTSDCRKPRYKDFLNELPESTPVSFKNLYPDANPHALDLLERMLIFDPRDRISSTEALAHPYLSNLNSGIEIAKVAPPLTIVKEEFAFEPVKLTIEQLRQEILREENLTKEDRWMRDDLINYYNNKNDLAFTRKSLKEYTLPKADTLSSPPSTKSSSLDNSLPSTTLPLPESSSKYMNEAIIPLKSCVLPHTQSIVGVEVEKSDSTTVCPADAQQQSATSTSDIVDLLKKNELHNRKPRALPNNGARPSKTEILVPLIEEVHESIRRDLYPDDPKNILSEIDRYGLSNGVAVDGKSNDANQDKMYFEINSGDARSLQISDSLVSKFYGCFTESERTNPDEINENNVDSGKNDNNNSIGSNRQVNNGVLHNRYNKKDSRKIKNKSTGTTMCILV